MDKASIFGVVAGVGLVLTAIILGSPLATFINVQGMLIVAGGTFTATSIAFPTNELKLLFTVSRRVFRDPGDEMVAISQFLVKAIENHLVGDLGDILHRQYQILHLKD